MTRSSAIRMHETGGPEVLRWEPVELPQPGPGEARLRHTAIGLNFIDTYHRTGLYRTPLPAVLGSEAAGVVEAVGEGVDNVAVGDRVAYGTGPLGAYAEARNVPASVLVKLAPDVDDRIAAATMLKGMTAHYLLEIGRLREKRQVILVHAAAGGVGLLLCQWAKHLGATVIGAVGSEEKAELARANGCDHVVITGAVDLPARVGELTGGAKVDVVYDSVGKDTFADSLHSLRPRGLLVSFGQSSGAVPPFDPRVLATNGSLFFTRPTLGDYVQKPAELVGRAQDLFDAIRTGILKVRVAQTYPLREAMQAHRDLEARKTTGSTVLLP
ncbi:MAG TPA: quinone oxidoreductase [Labilithrix sp.]|nr:quinone oxidoreductase [Labilithrix sp.]